MLRRSLLLVNLVCLLALTGCCCGGWGSGYRGYATGGGCSSGACGAGPVGYAAPGYQQAALPGEVPVGTAYAPVPYGAVPATTALMPVESLPTYR